MAQHFCGFCNEKAEDAHVTACPICGGELHQGSKATVCACCGSVNVSAKQTTTPATTVVQAQDPVSVAKADPIKK